MRLLLVIGDAYPDVWTEFFFDEADSWPGFALCPIEDREGRLTGSPRVPMLLLYGLGTVKLAEKGDVVEFFDGLKWMVI